MAQRRRAARGNVHGSEIVGLTPGASASVAIIADTHGAPHPNARPLIERLSPRVILHAGDIGDLGVLDTFRGVAPVLAVRGNIDARAPGLVDSMDVDFIAGGRSALRVFLTHIAVYGPHLRAEVARAAIARSASLVVCGHSHVPFIGRDKGCIVFNPGSIGPRRFSLPITFGVLRIAAEGVSLHHVSCETGETWYPGGSAGPGPLASATG